MNKNIIKEFERFIIQIEFELNNAKTNEKKNEHYYRMRQVKNIIRIIKKYNKVIKSGEELEHIKGIGKGTVKRINEIIKTGKLSEVKINKNVLLKINNLVKVIGIGKDLAIKLIKNDINNVKQLKLAVKNKKIKVNRKVKLGLKYYGKYRMKLERKYVDKINNYLQKIIDKNLISIICGSYRRKEKVSNDIDLLIIYNEKYKVKLKDIVKHLKKNNFIIDDITYNKYSIKYMGFFKFKNIISRIDINLLPYKSMYSGLLYFTGSREFNQNMRYIAKKQGYKLNEFGLFKNNKRIKINSEKDIFNKLGLEYIKPENR